MDEFDYVKEAEEFIATKGGVKGLVDSKITKIPKFFIRKSENSQNDDTNNGLKLEVPVIDLQGISNGTASELERAKIIDHIREASQTWGFFQIINHGIPQGVIDEILQATKQLHEQPHEDKMELFTQDPMKQVRFFTIKGTFDKNHIARWRDAFACNFADAHLDPEAIPSIGRKEILDYMKEMKKMKEVLSGLLSEALGLSSDFLESIECLKSQYLTCLYYPACPEPELTYGSYRHSDATLLTLLIQDNVGGLQVLHENHWVDVHPLPGALIANIGDFMQIISNDKWKSVEHRVLSKLVGPKLSVACFFFPSTQTMMKKYGPVEELLSDDNPPIYKDVSYLEYVTHYQQVIRERNSSFRALTHFKI